MEPKLVRVWPHAVIVEAITEAITVVTEVDPPSDLRLEAFKAALQMSCQRRAEQSSVGIARPGIPGLN